MTNDKARLTFLGTGTSQGVPIIGCQCEVCRSTDKRDKRFRASALIEYEGLKILVDAGPDFRMQMLTAKVSHLDAILLTHNHKDHTGGLDDVRSLNYIDKRAAEIYCEKRVLDELIREYPYVFQFPKYPGAPEWHMNLIDERPFIVESNIEDKELEWVHDSGYHYRLADGTLIPTGNCLEDMIQNAKLAPTPLTAPAQVKADTTGSGPATDAADQVKADTTGSGPATDAAALVKGAVIIPIRGLHDKLPVLGFRFGDIAYITDMSSIPESEFEKLRNLKHLTLNTVSYNKHHSHFSLDEALALADRIGATNTWLTHLSHTFPRYEVFCQELDQLCQDRHIHSIVRPAYDGLVID